jgi:DNA-binding NtrC family response regulator
MVKPRILIVDDDDGILQILRGICESMGCEVSIAQNGKAALEKINNETFTIVISDIRMPQMDGVSLLNEIEKRGLDLPVIIMSGFSDYSAEEIDQRNGVVLLEKPFSKQQIQEVIESFVRFLPKADDAS